MKKTFLKVFSAIFFVVSISLSMNCNKNTNCKEINNQNCYCTKEYNPVCGCNNKTYGNACEAECFGIKDYTKGVCK